MNDEVVPRGDKITRVEELLLRQVNRAHFHDGRPGSGVFAPRPTDRGFSSVDCGTKTSPSDSFNRAIACGLSTVGVVAIALSEVHALALRAFEDPTTEPCENPYHAVIDFRSCKNPSQQKKLSSRLHAKIGLPGWKHGPIE